MSASQCTAFLGHQRVAAGSYADVAKSLKNLDLSTGSLAGVFPEWHAQPVGVMA